MPFYFTFFSFLVTCKKTLWPTGQAPRATYILSLSYLTLSHTDAHTPANCRESFLLKTPFRKMGYVFRLLHLLRFGYQISIAKLSIFFHTRKSICLRNALFSAKRRNAAGFSFISSRQAPHQCPPLSTVRGVSRNL